MRTAPTFLFVMFSAFAQNHPASTSPIPSCGPSEQDFDVKLDKTSHAVNQPQPGKALVYVIEVFQVPRKFFSGSPTIRIGLDGSWMGANRGNSYLSFSVTPGEHHLCGYWQSSLPDTSGQRSLAGFFAEAGKTYFFRVQTHGEFDSAEPETWSIDLQPIDADEGKYLVASYPLSISHLKKQNYELTRFRSQVNNDSEHDICGPVYFGFPMVWSASTAKSKKSLKVWRSIVR